MVSLGSPGLKAVEQKRVCLWIKLWIQWQKASGAPIFLSLSSIRACGTLSKALTRSTRRVWTSCPSCVFLWSAGFLKQAHKNRNRGVHRTTFHESEVVRVNELEFEQKLSEAASNGKCDELMT